MSAAEPPRGASSAPLGQRGGDSRKRGDTTPRDLSGAVSVVGAATAGIGWDTRMNVAEIMAEATHVALDEAGLSLGDVDGVFAVTPYYWMASVTLADQLGIEPRVTDSTNIGGASAVAHVGHAVRAIACGQCDVAVIAYASTQRSDTGKLVTGADVLPYERPYGALFPISGYAMVMQRHMHEFGTTREQLAGVAVAASQWASLNPDALKREPLTIDDVLASPLVSDPLRKRDICLVTNGGGAIVLTSTERAKRLKKQALRVLGTGETHSHCHVSNMRSFTATAAVESARAAFEMAGLGPRDMDVAQIYDAFTIMVVLGLEDLGFCAKGEGGRMIDAGIGPGGKLAVNTSGGGLRYCHPGMFGIFLLVEAVRQLRGECGRRQVDDARLALVHGFGGVLAGNATVVLGRGG
jgi:acetyl-CoA acetyltransferase